MGTSKTIRFIGTYLFALFVGNFIVYEIDRMSVHYGQLPMSMGKYIFVNVAAVLIGIFIYASISKTKR